MKTRALNGRFVKGTLQTADERRARRKDYYLRNKDHIIAKSIEWGRANKERRNLARRAWREKNKTLTNHYTRRYIYRRKHADGSYTYEQEVELYKLLPTCPYCNTSKSDTIDHVVPLSRGGSNDVTNLLVCCRSCNSKKRNKTLLEYNPILFMMLNKIHG